MTRHNWYTCESQRTMRVVFQAQQITCQASICISHIINLLEFSFCRIKSRMRKASTFGPIFPKCCAWSTSTWHVGVTHAASNAIERKLHQIIPSACFWCIIYVEVTPLSHQLHAHAATNSTDIYKLSETDLFCFIVFKWKKIILYVIRENWSDRHSPLSANLSPIPRTAEPALDRETPDGKR